MLLNRFRRLAARGLEQQQKRRQQIRSQVRGQYFPQLTRMPVRPLYRVWYLGVLEQTRAGLGRQINWLEGILTELKSIHSGLERSIGSQEVVDAYDTVDATTGDGTTIDVQSNGSSAPTSSTTTGQKVSNRVLFSIFEGLDSEDMTVDDYPRADVVNHELESRGYSRLDKNSIDSAYDRWYHEEKKEEHEGREEDDDSGKEVTQKALFAVFEDMENRKSEFTDDGKYPLVSKVNERLEKKGYRHTSQKQMHKAFDSWKKEEEEEEGEDNHDLKAVTSRALHSVFEDMEGKWDEFTDDHRYPLVSRVNERLEKKGYQHAAQKQVHSEYDSWVEEEEHEGEHPKPTKEVTERALHSVFEQMEGKRDEYTDDGRYPLIAKVNSRLEKMGYEHATQKKVHQEYDDWVKEEESEGEHPTGLKSPTNRALDEVFEEMHGHKSEFTDGGKYPLVAKVNDRLAKKGYANATQKQIHKEYDSWKEKDEAEEQQEEKETVSSRRS